MQKIPVYLDHNLLSRTRPHRAEREDFLAIFRAGQRANAIYVVSDVHIREARGSADAEGFALAMEEIDVWYLEEQLAAEAAISIIPNHASNLVRAQKDFIESSITMMEDNYKVMHFAAGWEPEITGAQLSGELERSWKNFFRSASSAVPNEFRHLLPAYDPSLVPTAELLDRLAQEARTAKSSLPFVQGDPRYDPLLMPADEVVEWLLSNLEPRERCNFEESFPRNFWLDPSKRSSIALVSLAAVLVEWRVIKGSGFSKGKIEGRWQRYRAQMRDNEHIGKAAFCAAFITADKGAARLARAIYSYAGVGTEVRYVAIGKKVLYP